MAILQLCDTSHTSEIGDRIFGENLGIASALSPKNNRRVIYICTIKHQLNKQQNHKQTDKLLIEMIEILKIFEN